MFSVSSLQILFDWHQTNRRIIYNGFLETFLVPSVERMFAEDFIFQDDNAFCHRAKDMKNIPSKKKQHLMAFVPMT